MNPDNMIPPSHMWIRLQAKLQRAYTQTFWRTVYAADPWYRNMREGGGLLLPVEAQACHAAAVDCVNRGILRVLT